MSYYLEIQGKKEHEILRDVLEELESLDASYAVQQLLHPDVDLRSLIVDSDAEELLKQWEKMQTGMSEAEMYRFTIAHIARQVSLLRMPPDTEVMHEELL